MNKPISIAYNCDRMDFLKKFESKSVNLLCDDPPYGINAPNMQMGSNPKRSKYDGYGSGPGISTTVKMKARLNQGSGKLKNIILNSSDCSWDQVPPAEYFTEAFRVTQNQIFFGGNYFLLPPTRVIGCWDKMQPWENFSQWEFIWTSFDVPAFIFRYSNTGGANAETKIHETQKPVAIYSYLFKKFCKPGQTIIDCHLGSQSSRIAAYKLGIDFYGCENNKQKYNDGCARFDKECLGEITTSEGIMIKQGNLFDNND